MLIVCLYTTSNEKLDKDELYETISKSIIDMEKKQIKLNDEYNEEKKILLIKFFTKLNAHDIVKSIKKKGIPTTIIVPDERFEYVKKYFNWLQVIVSSYINKGNIMLSWMKI